VIARSSTRRGSAETGPASRHQIPCAMVLSRQPIPVASYEPAHDRWVGSCENRGAAYARLPSKAVRRSRVANFFVAGKIDFADSARLVSTRRMRSECGDVDRAYPSLVELSGGSYEARRCRASEREAARGHEQLIPRISRRHAAIAKIAVMVTGRRIAASGVVQKVLDSGHSPMGGNRTPPAFFDQAGCRMFGAKRGPTPGPSDRAESAGEQPWLRSKAMAVVKFQA